MAVAAAVAAVTCLLEQVKEIEIWYKDLISGSEDEFKQLHNYLSMVETFLKGKAKKSDVLSEQERSITEVLYETQETIDTYLCEAIQAKSSRRQMIRFMINRYGYSLAKKVKFIREDKLEPLRDVLKCAEKVSDGSEVEEDPQTEFRKMPIRQDRVVGFEDEVAKITDSLKQENERLDVIPIIGMPGLGKTTLAWKIYKSEEICFHFPIRIWIHIPQNFYRRDMFLQILRMFISSQDVSNHDDEELAQTVRAYLKREKFLLVLDNVRSVEVWKEIEQVLPLSNGNGKVLLTSRDFVMYSSQREPHQLRSLTDEESWTLLQHEVFGELDACPPELADIGKHIALKCNGVPLAIVVIGGVLLDQLTKGRAIEEWEAVSKSVSNDALQNNKAQRIFHVMESSYNRLPYEMRYCFIYMGIFPEDYEVPVQMLLRLWIAEGFIEPKEGRTLEESGEDILNDLIRRNLLMAEKKNHMGKVKTCSVHYMVREFCISKSEEHNLFGKIKKWNTEEFPPASDVQNFRRLCSSSNLSKFLSEEHDAHVRSFMCFFNQPVELEPKYTSLIPGGFPKLRILESKSVKFHHFPAKFTKLIHLRYLSLFIDALTILPESISKLWNLQTLVVDTKRHSVTMKANMWRMFQLRHLKTKAAIVLNSKLDGEAGQNLQTLNRLSADSFTESVSKKAKSLKTLGISGKLGKIFERKLLENLYLLEKLKLVNSIVYKPTSEDMLPSLPQSNCFPPNLKRLTLTNTFLEWKHMSTLAMIDTLEVLKLKDNAFIGIYWNAMDDCFQQLQLLLIVNTDLVIWEASTKSFPRLGCLVLKNCENLDEIPVALVETLQKLDIDRLCQPAVDSARKIVELKRERVQEPIGKAHVKHINYHISGATDADIPVTSFI